MPRDDRELNFEKALASSLRSSNAPGNAASNAAAGNDCLDAETLAAYHERLLDHEEMAQRKTHIASCERCMEILAQLEATDAIPVEADRDLLLDQIVLDIPESAPEAPTPVTETPPPTETAPLAEVSSHAESEGEPEPEIEREPELVPTSAAAPSIDLSRAAAAPPAVLAASAGAKSTPSSATITFRSPHHERPKLVRFVALAGALAAGLIFWLVYRDQSNKTFELAQNHQQSKVEMPPQSPAPPPSIESSSSESPSLKNKDAAPSPQISEPKTATPQPQYSAAQSSAQPQSAPAQARSDADAVSNALADAKKTLDAARALEKSRSGYGASAQSQKPSAGSRDESAAAGALASPRGVLRTAQDTAARKLETANEPVIDSAIAAARLPSGIPSTPPPARTKMNPGVVSDSASVESDAAPAAQLSASASSDTLSKPMNGRFVATLTPLSVPAPGGTTIWRIGQGGMIQRSTNSGTTWSIQPSGIVSDLIAGSAYTDQICWLVGRSGTILRTTNGGATWQKINSPSNLDLLSVFSINADSAAITDAAGRAYETTSAGARWARTKLQP